MPTNFSSPKRSPSSAAGFGLVELIVSISIMVLITTVILAKHNSFDGASLLRGQAYAIALSAREVQLYAISATEAGAGSFRRVYGLYFDTANLPNSYKIFLDAPSGTESNDFFDDGEEFGKQGLLDNRFEISAIRLIGGAGGTPDEVAVSFKRPNFDARIYTAANTEVSTAVSGVEIDVRVKSTGEVRTVEITKTGQISVKGL